MAGQIAIFEGWKAPWSGGSKMPRKRKGGLSKSPFAVKARACRKKTRTPGAFWKCVNKGKKVIGRGACAPGRYKRGKRKGRCRDRAPAWAVKMRRRASRDEG